MANHKKVTCPKCNGRGVIEAFGHIHNGMCFTCGGAGVIEVKGKKEKNAILNAKLAKLNCRCINEICRLADEEGDVDPDAKAAVENRYADLSDMARRKYK